MISGISSPGGYFPQPLVTRNRTPGQNQPQVGAPADEPKPEAQPADLKAPDGDEEALSREYNLFDLASRQYDRILPQLELANSPVE